MSKVKDGNEFVVFPDNCRIKVSQLTWLTYETGAGGCPKFNTPDNTVFAIKRLKVIAEMFKSDGSYNGASERAERYAICLAFEKKYAEAVKLFTAIVGDSVDIFKTTDLHGHYKQPAPIVNRPKQLGFEGMHQFAIACSHVHENGDLAKSLFMKIAAQLPANCAHIRLQEILVNALRMLKEYGIDKFDDTDVKEKLDAAKEYQH